MKSSHKHARPVIVGLCLLALVGSAAAETLVSERARDWEELFRRTSGWTGADGIYSIPLRGNEDPRSADSTLFVFSDTFIGDVGPDGERLGGSTLVNNTLALLEGDQPDPSRIQFLWGDGAFGGPGAVFLPETPEAMDGDWYWLMDGIARDGVLRLFVLRLREDTGGFNFATDGVAMIETPIDAAGPPRAWSQVDTPLFLPPTEERGEVIFGAAVMDNTVESGSPSPDGWIYVYGTQNDPLNKRLLVARALPEDLSDFDAWRYWDGARWVPSPSDAVSVTTRVSSELSVTPIAPGRFAAVFQLDTLGRDVVVRLGDSPVGPFGPHQTVWTAPEPELDSDVFVYNAKAHPHLSEPGELLISYNVNTLDFFDHFAFSDIYRPRFIRVRLEP